MFRRLIPALSLLLLAGPVIAATAPSTAYVSQSTAHDSAARSKHHHRHHHHHRRHPHDGMSPTV
jgi:hypothetical protein